IIGQSLQVIASEDDCARVCRRVGTHRVHLLALNGDLLIREENFQRCIQGDGLSGGHLDRGFHLGEARRGDANGVRTWAKAGDGVLTAFIGAGRFLRSALSYSGNGGARDDGSGIVSDCSLNGSDLLLSEGSTGQESSA